MADLNKGQEPRSHGFGGRTADYGFAKAFNKLPHCPSFEKLKQPGKEESDRVKIASNGSVLSMDSSHVEPEVVDATSNMSSFQQIHKFTMHNTMKAV